MVAAIFLPSWITDEKYLTSATWGLVAATILLVLTALLTIAFTWIQLSIQRRQTRIDNLEKQIDRFESEVFQRTRRSLATKRLDKNDELVILDIKDIPIELQEILDFFEHLAFLVRRGHLGTYDVWHTFATWIGPVYWDSREYIAIEQLDDKTVYEDLVWLYQRMVRQDKKCHGEGLVWDTDEDLAGYYLYERGPEAVIPRKKPMKRKKKKFSKPGGAAQDDNDNKNSSDKAGDGSSDS